MARGRIPLEKKEHILTLLAIGKSQRQVSIETGVSLATVNKFAHEKPGELEHLRNIKKAEFIDKAWSVIGLYLDRLEDERVISKTPAQACTTVIGTLIDKTRLMSGETTENVRCEYVAEWGRDDAEDGEVI